jgi:hypothetical protein
MLMNEPSLAFLANRKLHLRKDGCTRLVESEFERSVRERTASIERRHSWKTQGRGARFTGAWAGHSSAANVPVLLTGLTRAPDGGLLYSMETDAVSGIFLCDADGVETRLFHTADYRVRHAALHRDGETLAVTAFHKEDMRSNIAVLPVHGTDFSEVTEGDSFDQCPSWVPGSKRRIVFQSAGIGRDASGRFAGLGPCIVQQLDLDSGDLDDVASEEGRDLLQPRSSEDESLYYIRKPYQTGISEATLVGSLKDAALFPFRMAQAIFQYFNAFSMMYAGKPLVTHKGAVQRRLDPRQLFIYGNLANAHAALAEHEDGQSRVPASWELVRCAPSGGKEVLATGVLTYDVAADGTVLYSNGCSIARLTPDGRSERVLYGESIEQVIAM